jgi:glycosyltransferase involved in cell wall biosynthesis
MGLEVTLAIVGLGTDSISTEPGVVGLGTTADATLSTLYSRCIAFMAPDDNEGFGITAVEAMAHGAPVIAANAGALPETVGDAGILIEPPSEQKLWVAATVAIATDKALRQQLAARARRRANLYSWQRAGAELALHIEQSLGVPPRTG